MAVHTRLGQCGVAIVAVAILDLLSPAAATAADANATASATIQDSLTLTHIVEGNQGNIFFGSIVPGNSPGWVQIDPSEKKKKRLEYSGVTVLNPKWISDAHFLVRGDANREYQIQIPSSLTIVSGPNSMLVDSFLCCPESLGKEHGGWVYGTVGRLDRRGEDFLHVGATLHVGANQPGGFYEGEFTVTVAYQ